uniref:Uncharacterized protein n=1 Tax=Eptatretus burgeri TaxID=7764 RepID=A0A8C4NJ68_EPTBU
MYKSTREGIVHMYKNTREGIVHVYKNTREGVVHMYKNTREGVVHVKNNEHISSLHKAIFIQVTVDAVGSGPSFPLLGFGLVFLTVRFKEFPVIMRQNV